MGIIRDIMRKESLRALPIPVRNALRKLGRDIRDARLRRRLPTTVVANRALIDRKTLGKVEHGDPGVSTGTYATVLFVLGMADRLAELADPRFDRVGLALEEERLPKRIRSMSGSRSIRPENE
jgi:hypothetical protein